MGCRRIFSAETLSLGFETKTSTAPGAVAPLLIAALLSSLLARVHAQEQLPKISSAHQKLVRWIGYSSDGKALATASFDGSLQIRDAGSGELRTTLTGHNGQVFWGSFSDDGRTFASGGDDRVVRLWELDSGEVRAELMGHQSAVWTGAVTPDGKRIISGAPDTTVFIWDVSCQKVERSFKHTAPVWWIAVSHDSRIAAIAGGDGKVTLYDLDSGNAARTFGDHAGGVYCVAFSRDGSLIATAGADSRSKIWHAATGILKSTLPQFGPVYAVAFSPDGEQLATGGADYAVRLWNIDKESFRAKMTGHRDTVWTVAFNPRGSHFASAGGDGDVLVWNFDDKSVSPPTKLPRQVDLRPALRRLGLPVVPQGSRNTCSVHTFTRALEFAASKQEKRGIRLSDEYLNWACNQVIGNTGPNAVDRGQFFEDLWKGYCKHGICEAATMPFSQRFDPIAAPSETAVKSKQEMQRHTFVWRDITGPGVEDEVVVAEARSVLARGWPLLAGSTHSLLVVGYVDQPRGGFFIVADSGAGTFIDKVTEDRLHSAIPYARVKDYGFSWVECLNILK